MQKTKVAIYGLTTEGYSIASKIVDRAAVTIVDDTLQMAMELDPRTVKGHPSLQELVGGESLMGLKPISQVLSEARFVFFAPRLRKSGDESIIESNAKIREVAKNVSKGTLVINTLPMGVGGNADNIAMIEKQTGLKVGGTLNYGYSPVRPGAEPGMVALFAKVRDAPSPEDLGMKSTSGDIISSELSYVSSVLEDGTRMAADVELMRKARGQKTDRGDSEERYIDDLASLVYDLTAVQASEDVGEPLTYLSGAALKSLDNHVRYIVDETRELLRQMQLKASRTRVVVAWSIDKYEMRADRMRTAESLAERLRDYVTDVKHVQMQTEEEIVDSYKHTVAIACSAKDREWVLGLRRTGRAQEMTVLKATPSISRE